jgi:hypothetical protein
MTTKHNPFTMCVTIPLVGKLQVVDTCPEVLTFANSMIPAHVKGKIISWEVVSGKVKFNVTHYSQELAHALKTHVLHILPETLQAFRLHSHSIPNPPSMTENLVKTQSLGYKQAVSAELKGYLSKANDLMYAMQAHFKELHDIHMSGEAIPHAVEQDYFEYRHELHCQRNEALSSAEVLTKLLAVL